MTLDIVLKDEIESLISERVNSKEWWIIPLFSADGRKVSSYIEDEFYMDDNNDKFEVVMGYFEDIGFGGFALAKKSEMKKEDLEKIINKEMNDEQDFLITADTPISVIRFLIKIQNK